MQTHFVSDADRSRYLFSALSARWVLDGSVLVGGGLWLSSLFTSDAVGLALFAVLATFGYGAVSAVVSYGIGPDFFETTGPWGLVFVQFDAVVLGCLLATNVFLSTPRLRLFVTFVLLFATTGHRLGGRLSGPTHVG